MNTERNVADEAKRKDLLERIKKQHPVGAKRWFYGKMVEVVGYDDSYSVPYILGNVEDTYRGGFKTQLFTRCQLKERP